MKRRRFVHRILTGVPAVALSGCLGNSPTEGDETEASTRSLESLRISAERTDDPSASVTVVNASDERSTDVFEMSVVTQVIEKASRSGEMEMNLVTGRQGKQVEDALRDVPRSEGRKPGYYFRYRGSVYRILLVYNG